MNKYLCYYGNKKIQVESDTSYHAQKKACDIFKIPQNKGYKITVVLCKTSDGREIIHAPQNVVI